MYTFIIYMNLYNNLDIIIIIIYAQTHVCSVSLSRWWHLSVISQSNRGHDKYNYNCFVLNNHYCCFLRRYWCLWTWHTTGTLLFTLESTRTMQTNDLSWIVVSDSKLKTKSRLVRRTELSLRADDDLFLRFTNRWRFSTYVCVTIDLRGPFWSDNTYLNRLLTVDEDTIQQELALLTNISHHGRL